MSNKPKRDFNHQQYSNNFQQYLESNRDGLIGGENINKRIELISNFLPIGRRILEIGSGAGDDAKSLADKGYKVIASDYVEAFVKSLKQKGLETITFDAKQDKVNQKIDAIYANAVFVHFSPDEIATFLKNIKDDLENERLIFLSLIKGDGYERSARSRGFERDFYYYNTATIKNLLEKSGLDVVYENDEDPKWIQLIAKFR